MNSYEALTDPILLKMLTEEAGEFLTAEEQQAKLLDNIKIKKQTYGPKQNLPNNSE